MIHLALVCWYITAVMISPPSVFLALLLVSLLGDQPVAGKPQWD
jgi:hypothetical protein